MVDNEYSTVKYVIKYEDDGTGILLPVFNSKKIRRSSVKRFKNCQHKLAPLTKCAEMLLRFITEEMDASNNIVHTKTLRHNFDKHMRKDCNLKYADYTIKKAFYELVNQGLIISYGIRSDHTVNPYYFFKGSEKARKDLIHALLHEARKNTHARSNLKQALDF